MEPLVQFDDRWSEFLEKVNQIPFNSSYEEACNITGISFKFFSDLVENSMAKWVDSTTTSLFNGIANIRMGSVPHGNIFSDLIWQTRFITMARTTKLMLLYHIAVVKNNDVPVMVQNTKALTAEDNTGVFVINKILRALYLYWYVNSKKQVKLPAKLYRGIRADDLYNHENFETAVAAIWASDDTHLMKRKKAIDVLIKWICDKKLHQITDAKLLSFTSSVSAAKNFSNGTGFCLVVDPRKVEVITSEIHDADNIGGTNMMSGKNEREWIIRIPEDYQFKPEDIIINDLEYFIAEENPLAVSMLNHDDQQAIYHIDGKKITAWYSWHNQNSGGLLFKLNNEFPENRTAFKTQYGFDPLPNPKNLMKITDFKIIPRKQW